MISARLFASAASLVVSSVAWSADAGEQAVGRLNHAGYRQQMHCTATLIGPDRALTAAHCVEVNDVGEMHLLLGYDRAEWAEDLRPASAAKSAPPRDVAALCLRGPARTAPLSVSLVAPAPGERLLVIGYPVPRRHVQSRTECAVETVAALGSFTLACPMNPGASGAPVLRQTGQGLEVVGVISATNRTHSVAFRPGGESTAACPPNAE